ncbi:MAG: CDGSH iron-sulfur domain-containing protein [Varibaculum sp.]|nr:CDGSH iron-sulfur domain-containing protein [Varibaculum sp.]
MSESKIKILPNGPYKVTGDVTLDEKLIEPAPKHSFQWREGRELPQGEEYALCRCGHSHNPPFCDGTHAQIGFTGPETADKTPYAERIEVFEGPRVDVADDHRCAFARFCHADNSEVWTLTMTAEDEKQESLARHTADACPAGRMTVREHSGELVEPDLAEQITVVQDPQNYTSAGLYVQGGIELEGADGQQYETRERYMLCRCGRSRNKPFCDASHIPAHYDDGHAMD